MQLLNVLLNDSLIVKVLDVLQNLRYLLVVSILASPDLEEIRGNAEAFADSDISFFGILTDTSQDALKDFFVVLLLIFEV